MNFGTDGFIYRVCEWITRFVYANVLWILFSVMGIVVVGIFPATSALFAITHKWVMGEYDTPIFTTFYQTFKKELVKSNLLGYSLSLLGFILFVDVKFWMAMDNAYSVILLILSFTLVISYIVVAVYIFPVISHFNVKLHEFIRNAFFIGMSHPLITLMMIISTFIVGYLTLTFSVLLPFFSVSVLSYVLTRLAYNAFQKIDLKDNQKN